MLVTIIRPEERLAPFVRNFTVVETGKEAATRMLLPDSSVILGFRYGGFSRDLNDADPAPLATASFAGLQASARRMYTSPNAGVVLATFYEAEAPRFFREPLHQLYGRTVPIDALLSPREVRRVGSKIAEAKDHAARVAAFEEFLLGRLETSRGDPLVRAAVRMLRSGGGTVRVETIARELDLSLDRLEKRFRSAVGTTPKHLASIYRMQRVVELVRAGSSLTEVAIQAGFFDQSHFIREFKKYTGESPQRFFASTDHC